MEFFNGHGRRKPYASASNCPRPEGTAKFPMRVRSFYQPSRSAGARQLILLYLSRKKDCRALMSRVKTLGNPGLPRKIGRVLDSVRSKAENGVEADAILRRAVLQLISQRDTHSARKRIGQGKQRRFIICAATLFAKITYSRDDHCCRVT